MRTRIDPLRALREARPADSSRTACASATDRVWARTSLRIRSQRRHARWGRRAGVAAAVCAALGVVGWVSSRPVPRSAPSSHAEDVDAWGPWVARAIAGDTVARHRIRTAGPRVRDALLQAAQRRRADAPKALALFALSGAPQRSSHVEQVAQYIEDPATRVAAIGLLARGVHRRCVHALGSALVRYPDAEQAIVAGLDRVMRRGRRHAAWGALLEGVAAGRALALGRALSTAGPAGVSRVLQVMPPDLAGASVVRDAVREAPDLVRARLLRLAAGGNQAALALVGEAALPEATRTLESVARTNEPPVALRAVVWLRGVGTVRAVAALGRVLTREDAVGDRVRAMLSDLPPQAVAALARRAAQSRRDRVASMRALACSAAGILRLQALATQQRLRDAVVAALETSSHPDAGAALRALVEPTPPRIGPRRGVPGVARRATRARRSI